MKTDNASSGSSSRGETSEPKPPPPSTSPDKLSEADFLSQQAHNAQLAMSKAFAEMKTRLGQGADPKLWAKEYPWVTVGAAAVAGFLTAYTLIPSKEEQALKRLAKIERALNPPRPRHEDHSNGDGDEKKEEAKGGILSTIVHEALGVVRPALVSLLTANLANPVAAGAAQASSDPVEDSQFYGDPNMPAGGMPPYGGT